MWSLEGDFAQKVAKLDSASFVELLNAAIHNPYQDVKFLLSSISKSGDVINNVDFAAEAAWGRDRAGRHEQINAPWVTSVADGSRAPFPLRLRHAKQYTGDRVVLIGDAGHIVHPLAGQGLNLGLSDAASLSETVISCIKNGQDIGSSI